MGKNARIRAARAQIRAGGDILSNVEGPFPIASLRLRPRTLRRLAATPVPRGEPDPLRPGGWPDGWPTSQWEGEPARWFSVEPRPVPHTARGWARAYRRREAKRQARALGGAVIVDDPLDVVPA